MTWPHKLALLLMRRIVAPNGYTHLLDPLSKRYSWRFVRATLSTLLTLLFRALLHCMASVAAFTLLSLIVLCYKETYTHVAREFFKGE